MRKLFTPRPYQLDIEEHFITNSRSAAWAFMGAGKSVSTLTALDKMFLSGYETKPALILAPLRVAQSVWPDEAAKWEHLSGMEIQPIVGTAIDREEALRNKNASVFTMNYDNIPWLMEHLNGKWPFGRVISDESTRLKSHRLSQGGIRTRALAKVAHTKCTGFHELSGTPSPNGLKDLWGQIWYLDQGQRLGRTYDSFRQRWFQKSFDGYSVEPLPFAQGQIQERLKDICLSLDPKDYFDIKEPIVTPVYVELPVRAMDLYKDMEKRMFMEIEGNSIEAFNAASRTNKCLQLSNGAVYLDHDAANDNHPKAKEWREVHTAKIDALEDIIEEAAGMPVLVSYTFKSDLARLLKAFPKGRHLDKNPQTIRDFNAGKIEILFAHPQSAGHGLNLADGTNIIVFFSRDWNLESYLQILERIGPVRQLQAGYERNVFVYFIIARGTLDEDVAERHASKKSVQDILLAAMKRT